MKEIYHGIPKYIPEICPSAKREETHFDCLDGGCSQIYRVEQYVCPCFGKDGGGWITVSDQKLKILVDAVNRWNDCRSRIPNDDAWNLKGIKHFRISHFELLIEQFGEDEAQETKRELLKLLANGDKIGFNEDWGIGNIDGNSDGTYNVTKYYYGSESKPVEHGSIEDVFRFLKDFWGSPEPFSYAKAGYPNLER